MAFWNFCHDVLHVHVYLLPSLLVGIAMVAAGLVHNKEYNKRQDKYNEELSGQSPETPQAEI